MHLGLTTFLSHWVRTIFLSQKDNLIRIGEVIWGSVSYCWCFISHTWCCCYWIVSTFLTTIHTKVDATTSYQKHKLKPPSFWNKSQINEAWPRTWSPFPSHPNGPFIVPLSFREIYTAILHDLCCQSFVMWPRSLSDLTTMSRAIDQLKPPQREPHCKHFQACHFGLQKAPGCVFEAL